MTQKIKIAVVGLGKMGLSHHAMIHAHPRVEVAAVCDATGYVLDVLNKYTGVRTYTDFDAMLAEVKLDAVIIATPSSMHAKMVNAALANGLHVFCEKPFCLDTGMASKLPARPQKKAWSIKSVTTTALSVRFKKSKDYSTPMPSAR